MSYLNWAGDDTVFLFVRTEAVLGDTQYPQEQTDRDTLRPEYPQRTHLGNPKSLIFKCVMINLGAVILERNRVLFFLLIKTIINSLKEKVSS